MSGLIFFEVDTAYDFMRADGKLYVPDAEEIIPQLERLTEHAHNAGIQILASADNHSLDDEEISDNPDFRVTFPPHCMIGTPGQERIPETAFRNPLVFEPVEPDPDAVRERVREHRGEVVFHKNKWDVFTNPHTELVLNELDPDAVVLYGVATDYCDRYALEGMLERRPRGTYYLVTDAVKPIYRDAAEQLLAEWARRGVELVTTEEAVELSVAPA